MVIVDIFSSLCHLVPIKRKTAADIVKGLSDIFTKHGAPWYIWLEIILHNKTSKFKIFLIYSKVGHGKGNIEQNIRKGDARMER